ncbi:hypothetical protein I4U23_003946 [Adineta vaga]|nr:hypothetical protein I4U23_003946 [Adineta vaga]
MIFTSRYSIILHPHCLVFVSRYSSKSHHSPIFESIASQVTKESRKIFPYISVRRTTLSSANPTCTINRRI